MRCIHGFARCWPVGDISIGGRGTEDSAVEKEVADGRIRRYHLETKGVRDLNVLTESKRESKL